MEQIRKWKREQVKVCGWMIPYSKDKPQFPFKLKLVPDKNFDIKNKNGVGIL